MGQQIAQRIVRTRRLQHGTPRFVRKIVVRQPRTHGQPAEDGAHAARRVVARHLADLRVGAHATEIARLPAVEQVAQRDERGGLAGPARRRQHEVTLGSDQSRKFIGVQAVQRTDRIMIVRAHRACDVEEAHGPIMASAAAAHRWSPGGTDARCGGSGRLVPCGNRPRSGARRQAKVHDCGPGSTIFGQCRA